MSEDVKKKILLEMDVIGFEELADIQDEIYGAQLRIKKLLKEQSKENTRERGNEIEQQKLYVKELKKKYREVEKGIAAEKGSLNELRAELNRLIAEQGKAGNLGSKAWNEQAARIKELRNEVAGFEAQYGTFSRNVGNYSGGITDAFSQMGGNIGMAARNLSQLG
jgi:chromosome segregation ATPase